MTDAVVQREALRVEAIALATAQGDAEEVQIASTGFLVDMPAQYALLDASANAVTRYCAACCCCAAADICGCDAGQLKLSELHAGTILMWVARYTQEWVARRHQLCMLKVRCCVTHLMTDLVLNLIIYLCRYKERTELPTCLTKQIKLKYTSSWPLA